jgi:integrase
LRLALYAGGQRMRQLLRATVADWDGERLRLFDTKGRRQAPRAHLLPLGPEAADIVERLAAQAKERGTQLLYSTHGTKPLSDFTLSKRVNEISAAMGGEAFDLRDIRRTAETMLAAMGVNRDIRAQLLSHGISGVQAMHYDRHDYIKEKADALAKWEKRLAEIEKGKKTKKR